MAIALMLSLIFIIYKIIVDNINDPPKLVFGFAKLILLILGSYILVLISGKTLNPEGGWLFLYAFLPVCLTTSVALFIIGAAMKILKRYK